MIEFIKNLFTKSIIDLENPRIFKTVIISIILTLLLAVIIFILFYYVLFTSFFQLANPVNFEEGGVMAFILSLKVISYILGLLQFFISWLLVSLILVPVVTIISSLFA